MQLKDATILLVDDEAGLLEIFKLWIEREGCRVYTATNGKEGLEVALRNDLDVIVSDVRMPILTGIEMVRHLKTAKTYVPKVVLISGFSDLSERECFDLGIEVALQKPTRRANLLSAVRRCLMDRQEVWEQRQIEIPGKVLAMTFPSLATAVKEARFAFGRGGFCIRAVSDLPVGELIGLQIAFQFEHHAINGQGIIRWTEYSEQQIGIEITYVDDENRSWVVLTAGQQSTAFIPRSSGGQGQL